MLVRIVGVRYDRIQHYELFDIDDVDRALARFVELDAGKDTVVCRYIADTTTGMPRRQRQTRRPLARRATSPRVLRAENTIPKGPVRAKLFANGRSQAVRLPKEFRLPGAEVAIRREGDQVILQPLAPSGLPLRFWERLDALCEGIDFPDPEPLGAAFLDPSERS